VNGVRLVLAEDASESDLDAFGQAWGWVPLPSSRPTAQDVTTREWTSSRSPASIRYVDDPILGLRFLEVSGDGTEDVALWVAMLFPVKDREELDRMVRSVGDPESWSSLMSLAAIQGSLDFDPERFLILGNGLAHFDARVRLATLHGVAYLDWPAFDTPLQRITESDPDREVRAAAANLLADRHA